jgi:hypothetical protein
VGLRRQPNRHATKLPADASGHGVVRAGQRWAWCFVDETELPVPAAVEPYLRD